MAREYMRSPANAYTHARDANTRRGLDRLYFRLSLEFGLCTCSSQRGVSSESIPEQRWVVYEVDGDGGGSFLNFFQVLSTTLQHLHHVM